MQKRMLVPQPVPIPKPLFDLAPLPCMALTVEEAAEVLRVSRCTLLDLIDGEKLRVVRIGRRIIISIKAIDEFLNPTG